MNEAVLQGHFAHMGSNTTLMEGRTMDRELELRERMNTVRDALGALHEETGTRSLSSDEQEEWDEGVQFLKEGERMLARYDRARSSDSKGYYDKGVNVRMNRDPQDALNEARTAAPEAAKRILTDANLRAMETHSDHLSTGDQKHFESMLKRHSGDREWASNILARQSETYEKAWAKLVTGRGHLLTPDEQRATLNITTDAQGAHLLPTHLDPTVILTNDGTSNVVRGLARVVTLTAPGATSWNGITSAGMTATFQPELTEVTDGSPTFAKPNIPVHKAQAFASASIEALEDIANLAADLTMMFADARDRLEGAKHVSGTGSGQPKGVVTALDAVPGSEVDTIVAQVLGLADIHATYRAVPVRWRAKSQWLMHPFFALKIKELGTAVSASFSGELPEATTSKLVGRPVVESDDMPSTAFAATTTENALVFGDFSNYVIVDKPGSMAVEFIPHLFGTAANLPNGSVGWYAHWRTGADVVNPAGLRLLQDGA